MNTIIGWGKYISLFVGVMLMVLGVSSASAAKKNYVNPSEKCQPVILKNEEFFPALLRSIDEAQKEILISIFSFKAGEHKNSYPDRILTHLAKAQKRGVNVIVVLEKTENDSDDLNSQNKKTGKLLQEKGMDVFFDSKKKTTHTKIIVIDQRHIFLGSHNFTQSALKYNNEVSILLESTDIAGDIRNYILRIIKEGQ